MEGHFDDILKSQDRYVKKIFPRISQELNGGGNAAGAEPKSPHFNTALKEENPRKKKKHPADEAVMGNSIDGDKPETGSQMDFDSMMSMTSDADFAADNAMDQIGITEIEANERKRKFSETDGYDNMANKLAEPEKYLEGIPETRATFIPAQDLSMLDPVGNKGCCAPGGKGEKCIIF